MQPDPSMYERTMRRHRAALRQVRRGAGPMGRAAMDPAKAVEDVIAQTLPIGPGPKAEALARLVNGSEAA